MICKVKKKKKVIQQLQVYVRNQYIIFSHAQLTCDSYVERSLLRIYGKFLT